MVWLTASLATASALTFRTLASLGGDCPYPSAHGQAYLRMVYLFLVDYGPALKVEDCWTERLWAVALGLGTPVLLASQAPDPPHHCHLS